MIKKLSLILLAVLMLLPLGCGKEQGEALPDATQGASHEGAAATDAGGKETEAPAATEAGGPEENILRDYRYGCLVETNTMLFKRSDNILYFTDKEYKDWMPLCPKPDCNHNNENCDAWFGGDAGVWPYGNYLYYVQDTMCTDEGGKGYEVRRYTEAKLCRMRFDGTAHEVVCALPIPEAQAFTAYENGWAILWQGKYMIVGYTAYKDGNHETKENYNYVMDLDSLKTVPITYIDFSYEPEGVFAPLYGEGDLLYGIHAHFPGEITEETQLSDRIFTYERLDCATGEMAELGNMSTYINWGEGSIGFADGKLTYLVWEGGSVIELWQLDTETGETDVVYSSERDVPLPYYYDWTNGLWVQTFRIYGDEYKYTEPDWGVYVYDGGFELINKMLFTEMDEKDYDDICQIMITCQSEDYIFGQGPITEIDEYGEKHTYHVLGGTVPAWYLLKSELAEGRPVWRKWQP